MIEKPRIIEVSGVISPQNFDFGLNLDPRKTNAGPKFGTGGD
jgi:hypothetical protein